MGWLGRRRRKTAVIGTEMAAAVAAEKRHQLSRHGSSPLAGVRYEPAAGEYDLFRFVESATDDVIASIALDAVELRGQGLSDFRDALTQEDLYALLTFARRAAVRVLRGRTDQLTAGCAAAGLVDLARVDWRDAAVAVGLLACAANRTHTTLRAPLQAALAIAEPDTQRLLQQYANSDSDGFAVAGYREIATSTGPALAEDYGKPFDPTFDLLAVANSVVNVFEGDRYRVTGITTGTDIAPIWLPSEDPQMVEQARQSIRACLSISAAPRAQATTMFPAQMLLAHVAECAATQDAELLTKAAKRPATSDIAALAVSHDSVCVEVIARSTVKDVAPIESAASIERFREPIARVLFDHVNGG
jgi:hypothetical protein